MKKKTKFYLIVLLCSLVSSTLMLESHGNPTYEDLTTYSEYDPLNVFAQTTTRNTATNNRNDSNASVYKDYGVDFFEDFEILIDFKITAEEGKSSLGLFALSNTHGCWTELADGDFTVDRGEASSSPYVYPRIYLREKGGDYQSYDCPTWNAPYYLTIKRAGTALTCKVYSDANRATLLTTLAVTASHTTKFRYLQVGFGFNGTTDVSKLMSGYIENVDLQDGGEEGGKTALYFEEIFAPAGESNLHVLLYVEDRVVLAGTEESADIWKTIDNGANWIKKADYGATDSDITEFLRIGSTSIILASTSRKSGAGYGGSILRSVNKGDTWTKVKTLPFEQSRVNSLCHVGGDKILAGTRYKSGSPVGSEIWKSEDLGLTWAKVCTLGTGHMTSIQSMIYLGDGKVIAGGSADGDAGITARIYKSVDYGESWVQKKTFTEIIDILHMINVEGKILASTQDKGMIWKSTDQGETWDSVKDLGADTVLGDFVEVTVATVKWLFVGWGNVTDGDMTVYRSIDLGVTWTIFDELWDNLGTQQEILAFSMASYENNTVMCGSGDHTAQARIWAYDCGGAEEEEEEEEGEDWLSKELMTILGIGGIFLMVLSPTLTIAMVKAGRFEGIAYGFACFIMGLAFFIGWLYS